jgi:hypothetical protein
VTRRPSRVRRRRPPGAINLLGNVDHQGIGAATSGMGQRVRGGPLLHGGSPHKSVRYSLRTLLLDVPSWKHTLLLHLMKVTLFFFHSHTYLLRDLLHLLLVKPACYLFRVNMTVSMEGRSINEHSYIILLIVKFEFRNTYSCQPLGYWVLACSSTCTAGPKVGRARSEQSFQPRNYFTGYHTKFLTLSMPS